MPASHVLLGRLIVASLRDLAPIILVIAFFRIVVLDQPFPNLERIVTGLVAVGLALFVQGLELGLFPLGDAMAVTVPRKDPRGKSIGRG